MRLAQIIGWFVGTIVLPLTGWFLLLKSEVTANAIETSMLKDDVKAIAIEIKTDRTQLGSKLEDIQRSLGRIEGKIERRK